MTIGGLQGKSEGTDGNVTKASGHKVTRTHSVLDEITRTISFLDDFHRTSINIYIYLYIYVDM